MINEDIKILLVKRSLNLTRLAEILGDSVQNISQRMKRNALKDTDLKQITNALNIEVELTYKDKKTGETIYKSTL